MEHASNFFFISILLLFFIRGQFAQSPCPDIFEYKSDETGVYGLVHVYLRHQVPSVTLKIKFTVATQLSSNYLGKITPLDNNSDLNKQSNYGSPINYRLDFPVSSPIPRIISITVNNEVVCFGSGDSGEFVTTVNLEHSQSIGNGAFSGFGGSHILPQGDGLMSVLGGSRQPVTIYGDNHEFSSFTFDNVNGPSWTSSSDPFFLINNSQMDIDDRNRLPKPFGFNPFFQEQGGRPRPSQGVRPTFTTTTTTSRPPAPVDNNQCGININIDTVPLIYNGKSYNRGEWPWVVAIFKRKDAGLNYICAGTLISNRHVVTAAHCMHMKTSLTSINDIVVKVGVHNILDWDDDDVTLTRAISSATIHEAYNSTILSNDILLLTFTRAVEFNSYIKAACLWNGNSDLNLILEQAGVVTGWGVSELGPAGKGEPRMVRMPIVSTNACRASKLEFHKLTSATTFCAGDRNGVGPCLGDSGGGLYMRQNGRWTLRGIVSVSLLPPSGDMTCNLNEFIVFTDAAKYVTWLTEKMKT